MSRKKSFSEYVAFASMSADWVFKNLLFVGFLGFMALVYIANAHYAEKKVREIQALQKEVKTLRWEYMQLKSEVMYNYKYSEVANRVDRKGLNLRKPKKIVVR
jgi:hypothetical protein